jgi:transcription termination factor Rho
MSLESTALERSALERKDRDELATIAESLGTKPPARASKVKIIDLILELTGVSQPATTDDKPSRRRSPLKAAAPVNGGDRATTEPEADSLPDAEVPAEPTMSTASAPAQAEEPPAEWELEVGPIDEARPAPQPPEGETPPGNGRGGREPRSADQAERQGAERQGGQGHDQGGAEGAGPDGEPGNRRRRRRGRDRNREGGQQGGQQGGQGQGAQGQGGQGQGGAQQQPSTEEYVGEPIDVEGLLDLRDEGYGFLRLRGYLPSKEDVYVSVKQVRQLGLRKGDHLTGASRPAMRNEKNPALLRIDLVNGQDPESVRNRPKFEDLTPLFPDDKMRLELPDDPGNMTARIVDLISPIGKGQRGLIVSPPKAGKTTIMKQIARSIEQNNPEVHLIVLLVDERPEEVTDMKRWLKSPMSQVASSTFDRPSDEHTHVAELTIERAKRLVEEGKDVVIILDGITRLARAYNLAAPATGRIMSGGIDTGALYPPKKFFGAARNLEEGGSLTLLATALVETGSRMDEVIFEEFKGTGNMELRLDRKLAERRIYPAIDVEASSTRHEELLFPAKQLKLVWMLRRVLSGVGGGEGGSSGASLELLIDRLRTFKTNDEFLNEISKTPTAGS